MRRDVSEVTDYICSVLRERAEMIGIKISDINGEFRFFDSGVLDSMGFVSLIARLEDYFSVRIDFTLLPPEAFSTVSGLAATIADTSAL